jgi:hypothetical protein
VGTASSAWKLFSGVPLPPAPIDYLTANIKGTDVQAPSTKTQVVRTTFLGVASLASFFLTRSCARRARIQKASECSKNISDL